MSSLFLVLLMFSSISMDIFHIELLSRTMTCSPDMIYQALSVSSHVNHMYARDTNVLGD